VHTWQLQDAKSRFSELVDRTLAEGPQLVTRRGAEAVVVMAAPEYRRLLAGPSLLAVLNSAPRGEVLAVSRSAEPVRALDL
jgi:antitoxin Phd